MNSVALRVLESTARLLEPNEREAVLGDLVETNEGIWNGLPGILGLVLRRQVALWQNWRPWVAAFGVAVPSSFMLMGFSVSLSVACLRFVGVAPVSLGGQTAAAQFLPLAGQVMLLLGWAWTGGFLVGSVSRRTLWVSLVSYGSPCLFCLTRFHMESLSRFSLLLFVLPAAIGMAQGLKIYRLKPTLALTIALAVTGGTILLQLRSTAHWSNPVLWVVNSMLTWPAWFLVATARPKPAEAAARPAEQTGSTSL